MAESNWEQKSYQRGYARGYATGQKNISRHIDELMGLRTALEQIAAMDPEGQRADDLGRAARIARTYLDTAGVKGRRIDGDQPLPDLIRQLHRDGLGSDEIAATLTRLGRDSEADAAGISIRAVIQESAAGVQASAPALSDEECDKAAAQAMDRIAAAKRMHALDLNPDIQAHHTLRRELVRAGYALASGVEGRTK